MKKALFLVPVIFIVLVCALAFVLNINNRELEFSDYLVDGTDAFVLIKSEKILNNKKELKELSKIGMKLKTILYAGDINIDMKQFLVVKRYLKNIFLIHQSEVYDEEEITFNPESVIVGADTGLFTPLAEIVLNSYFYKEKDGISVMKQKNSDEVLEKEVYMVEYNKIFLLSFSRDSLRDYLNKLNLGKKNESFVKEYNLLRNKYIIMVGDLSVMSARLLEGNSLIKKINHVKITFEYDTTERKFAADVNFDGEGDLFTLVGNNGKNNGLLKKYVEKDDIYFTNKNMRKLLDYYLVSIANGREDYRKKIYDVFGYDVLEAADNLGKEIVVKYTDNGMAFVTELKNGEKTRKYLLSQGFKEKDRTFNILGLPFSIDGNIGFFNTEPYNPTEEISYIKESSFIYSNMNIGRLRGAEYFMGVYAEAEAITDNKNVKLRVLISKNDMSEFLTRIIEVMN